VFHRFAEDSVSFYIAFDAADSGNGGLEVAPLPLSKLRGKLIVDVTERPIRDEVVVGLDWQCPTLKAGDVLAFSAWTVHRSSANHSERDRSVYYPTYSTVKVGDPEQLYSLYYEFYWAWISKQFPAGDDPRIETIVAGDATRPSLHPVRGHQWT
jgi:hypothetical protein